MKRRDFVLGCSALAALASSRAMVPAWAIEPFERPKPGQMRLSLAAYSMRKYLADSKQAKKSMDLFDFVDYCFQLGLPGAELTSYYFPEDVDDDYILKLKRHCHLRGVTVSGGAIRNDFCQLDTAKIEKDIEHTQLWTDRYALLGAPAIRIFAGTQPQGQSWETTIDRCVAGCQRVSKYAEKKGVWMALENHGGVTAKAEGLLEIVRRVDSPMFGVNFDCGNFRSTSDPYQELEAIAPYAVNAQLKVDISPNGKREDTDLERVLKILRDAGYSGWVALEYEAAEEPKEAIPRHIEKLQKLLDA
ncbi:MAG: sugar phosphate isomerase/epimerase family protein [Aureliella sp.]